MLRRTAALSRAVGASVMALTLVTATVASADEPPAPPASAAAPEPAPAAAPATPLPTRPSRPLTLAPASEGTPASYKVLAVAVVAVAAGLWIRNKRRGTPGAKARSRIDVLGRTSLGVRNELLVVDVEGMRLLVGMTPSSIQTLAVLETPPEPAEAEAERRAADAVDAEAPAAPADALLGERPAFDAGSLRSLLAKRLEAQPERASSLPPPQPTAPAPRPRRTSAAKGQGEPRQRSARATRVAGQARGLLVALEEPKATAKAARDA